MQQTYVEVIAGKARFKAESTLRTFMFGVAQNLTRSHYRKAAARARLAERTALLSSGDAWLENDDAPIDAQRLWQAVRELSDRQRDVVELVFCNELTIEEAAHIMQVSVGTARQHYSRAKASLSRQLADLKDPLPGEGMTGAGNE